MGINTELIHGYEVFDKSTGATSIPICQSSTFKQEGVNKGQDYTYSRFGNPTVKAVEEAIAAIEKEGRCGCAFSSGMAAISAVLLSFSKGDHLVFCKSIYGGTFSLITQVLNRFGIEGTFVDETNLESFEEAIQDNTKAIYIETPSNPLLKITDIKGVVKIAKKHHLLTIIDNTFMTPQFQSPLTLGVDIVIHSATKFLNGHSDVVAGLVVTKDQELGEKIRSLKVTLGGILGPKDAWLLMRGMKTMGLRMKQSAASAQKIAEFLQEDPHIKNVYYPGLKSHPGYEIHQQQATSGGAVLSFELANHKEVELFATSLQYPICAVSLGGVESILSYPWTMSHACVPEEDRLKQGVTPGLLRLSVGIEDVEDLLADFKQALKKLDE